MMPLWGARHRITALHRPFRRGHGVTIERVYPKQECDDRDQEWIRKSHSFKTNRLAGLRQGWRFKSPWNYCIDTPANPRSTVFRWTSRPGSRTGRVRSISPFVMVKILVLAPIPRARVRMATAVNPGDFGRMRRPYRKSCQSVWVP
jgi:hypothetical protein